MSVALDLGGHSCRSLRVSRATLVGRRCRSMAAWLSDGERERAWLEQHGIPYFSCDGHLALIGKHAEELARLFPVPCQDLLHDGKVPYADAVTRQLIALIVEALLPPANVDDEVCCFSQPAHRQTAGPTDADLDRRLEFTSRLIRLRGYDPSPLNPAAALVLAEIEPEQFTGIGICVGASGGDLVLTHRGNPVVVMRTSRGGRWIDEELARRTGQVCQDLFEQRVYDVEAGRRRKEAASLVSPSDDNQQLVGELYRQLATDLAQGVERLVGANPLLVRFSQPLTILLGGGSAHVPGFDDLLRIEVARRLPPAIVGAIRRERNSPFTVARGCLIQASLMTKGRKAA